MNGSTAFHLKQIMSAEHLSLTQTAKQIGISPASMRKVLKDATMSQAVMFKINRFIDDHQAIIATKPGELPQAPEETAKETAAKPAATKKPAAKKPAAKAKPAAKKTEAKPAAKKTQTRSRTNKAETKNNAKSAKKTETKNNAKASNKSTSATKAAAAAVQTNLSLTETKPAAKPSRRQPKLNKSKAKRGFTIHQIDGEPIVPEAERQAEQKQPQQPAKQSANNQQAVEERAAKLAQAGVGSMDPKPTAKQEQPKAPVAEKQAQPKAQARIEQPKAQLKLTTNQVQPKAAKPEQAQSQNKQTTKQQQPKAQTKSDQAKNQAKSEQPKNQAKQAAKQEQPKAQAKPAAKQEQPKAQAKSAAKQEQPKAQAKSAAKQEQPKAQAKSAAKQEQPKAQAKPAAKQEQPKAQAEQPQSQAKPEQQAAKPATEPKEQAPVAAKAEPAKPAEATPVEQPQPETVNYDPLHNGAQTLQLFVDESFVHGNDYQRNMFIGVTVVDQNDAHALDQFANTLYPFGWQPGDEVKARGKNHEQIAAMLTQAHGEHAANFVAFSPQSDTGNFALGFGVLYPYLATILRVLDEIDDLPNKIRIALDRRNELEDEQLAVAARMLNAYVKAQTGRDVMFMLRTSDSKSTIGIQYSDFSAHAALSFTEEQLAACGITRLPDLGSKIGDQITLFSMIGLQKYMLDDRSVVQQQASYKNPVLNTAERLLRLASKATNLTQVPDETLTQAKLVINQLLQITPSAINGAINKMPFQTWYDMVARAAAMLHYTDATLPNFEIDPDAMQIAQDALNNIANLLASAK